MTESQEQRARELYDAGLNDPQVARSIGSSETSVRRWRNREGLPSATHALQRVISEHAERTVLAPQQTIPEDVEQVWQRALDKTDRKVRVAEAENLARVQIMTDKPIALSISSDWHITPNGACDLRGLGRYAEAVRDTPGAYAVAVGDLTDNPIKWSKSMDEVPEALVLLARVFGTFGYKLLGTTSGNHDDWTAQFAGIDMLKWLAERDRIHYAPDELIYLVELIDPKTQEMTARYVVATRHKYYRHSNLNPSHTAFRWLEDRVGQWPVGEDGGELVPDILAVGHNHVATVDVRSKPNKAIWGARMGAWHRSGHSRAGGWPSSPPTAPTFVLFPHRDQPIRGYEDYAAAFSDLKLLRG